MNVSLIRKKIGLLIRWAAKKNIPGSTSLLTNFFPQHIYHVSYFFLTKKNNVKKAQLILRHWMPKSEKECKYQDRVNEIADVIFSKTESIIHVPSVATEQTAFNDNVIFCLHNSAPYDLAGYWHRTSSIFSALKPVGINLSAVTRPGYPWDLIKHRQEPYRDSESIDGVVIHRLNSHDFNYRQVTDSQYILNYAQQVAALAKQSRHSIIHGHSNYLNGLAAAQAAKLIGIKSVYEARGLWHYTRLSKEPAYQNTDMFQYDDLMERMAMSKADAVVTLSSAMKSLIASWGIADDKIWVIPNAVNTDIFKPHPKATELRKNITTDDTFLIGFIGSITVYEGLEELISACANLKRAGLNLHLAIVGSGPYENEIKTLAAQHDCVSVHGRIPHDEVTAWYSVFDMCAYPRRPDIVCQYVPPMKVLEAMAMGIPVLVSNLPPLVEMVDNGNVGTICDTSASSLLEKIEFMYSNREHIHSIAEKAISWVAQNRTWHRNAAIYKDMYRSLYQGLDKQ
jgi:glycosyltransferase involved in cell wall biosynthesis